LSREENIKWIIQISVMATDLIILVVACCPVFLMPLNPLAWFAFLLVYWQWKKDGGLFAWQSGNIKEFFKVAKKIGL